MEPLGFLAFKVGCLVTHTSTSSLILRTLAEQIRFLEPEAVKASCQLSRHEMCSNYSSRVSIFGLVVHRLRGL